MKKINFRESVKRIPSTTYGTFALYRYPAKFIPQAIAHILEKYGEPKMSIIDPFAGYGTAGLVSRIYGFDYEMWDLNPLLKILHDVAILEPRDFDIQNLVQEIIDFSGKKFEPEWPNFEYWYHEKFIPFLQQIWGFYHYHLDDEYTKLLLTIPLLQVSRHFSYDDMERMELSKSPKSEERVNSLLSMDWKTKFSQMLKKKIKKILKGLREYQNLSPQQVETKVEGGVDSMTKKLEEERDLLITSPPYMQSQEYIRHAKLNLFWLGKSRKEILDLKRLEIPYRDVEKIKVKSETFSQFREDIDGSH